MWFYKIDDILWHFKKRSKQIEYVWAQLFAIFFWSDVWMTHKPSFSRIANISRSPQTIKGKCILHQFYIASNVRRTIIVAIQTISGSSHILSLNCAKPNTQNSQFKGLSQVFLGIMCGAQFEEKLIRSAKACWYFLFV